MAEKRARRNYSEEFKKQMVQLYNAGKPRAEIIREYDDLRCQGRVLGKV